MPRKIIDQLMSIGVVVEDNIDRHGTMTIVLGKKRQVTIYADELSNVKNVSDLLNLMIENEIDYYVDSNRDYF